MMIVIEHQTVTERRAFRADWCKAVERQRRIRMAIAVIHRYLGAR